MLFDFYGVCTKDRVAWTAGGEDEGFLLLERDDKGSIDAAFELF